MRRNEYDSLILHEMERNFDRVFPTMAIAYFTLAMLVFKSSQLFALIYGISAILVLSIYFLRNYINAFIKARIVLVLVVILASVSIFITGFVGTGLLIFLLLHIVVAAFFEFRTGIIISSCAILVSFILWILVSLNIYRYEGELADILNSHTDWNLHLVTYFFIVIAIHMIFRIIKSYLIKNIIDLENSVGKVSKLAYYDSLTKLPNRTLFNSELHKIIKCDNCSGYLVLFDLKEFTRINSIHGNDYGDNILEKIGISIAEIKNDDELVARISGNEFGYWLNDISYDAMILRLKSVKQQLRDRLREFDIAKNIEFHVGYAHFPTDANKAKDIYRKASMALDYSKKHEDSTIVAYNKTIELITQEEELLKNLIMEALDKDSFQIAYQEKVDSRTGKVYGVEALARWNADNKKWISPSVFMPIIEKYNLSLPFTKQVIRKVLSEYPLLQKAYSNDIKVSINCSPSNIADTQFMEFLISEVSENLYCPQRFMIEITEGIMINNIKEVMYILNELREFGIGISIDDFGTGYSSLSYISDLELDEVKIDKSFIDKFDKDPRTYALVDAVISVCKSFNISTVAEGVETKEQEELLSNMGCYNIQGFLHSKPKLIWDIYLKKENKK